MDPRGDAIPPWQQRDSSPSPDQRSSYETVTPIHSSRRSSELDAAENGSALQSTSRSRSRSRSPVDIVEGAGVGGYRRNNVGSQLSPIHEPPGGGVNRESVSPDLSHLKAVKVEVTLCQYITCRCTRPQFADLMCFQRRFVVVVCSYD